MSEYLYLPENCISRGDFPGDDKEFRELRKSSDSFLRALQKGSEITKASPSTVFLFDIDWTLVYEDSAIPILTIGN